MSQETIFKGKEPIKVTIMGESVFINGKDVTANLGKKKRMATIALLLKMLKIVRWQLALKPK